MDLSLVILNYKQKGLVKQCLKGIVVSQPKLAYEIIVVDNNSADGCLEMATDLFKSSLKFNHLTIPPIVTIQAGFNGGFAAGNNIGMKKALGKYVVVLNPDIAIVPGVLEELFNYMEAHGEVGILGPRLINPDRSVQDSCRRWPVLLTPLFRRTSLGRLNIGQKDIDRYLMKDFNHRDIREVNWLFGAFLFIRRSALDQVGFFDDRFFMYFEDLDLCRRFWQGGQKVIYYGAVEIIHYHGRMSAQRNSILDVLSKGGRTHIASGLKYFLKYRGQSLPAGQK